MSSRIAVAGLAAIALLVVALWLGTGLSSRSNKPPDQQSSHVAATRLDFSAFQGDWIRHGAKATVDSSGVLTVVGTGSYAGPVTTVHLAAVVDNVAYGTDDSTDFPVWIVLLPYNMILYIDIIEQVGLIYCAPNAQIQDSVTGQALPGMRPAPCGA